MLAIVHDGAEPLTEIREIFAENRLEAIAAARQGVLRMALTGGRQWASTGPAARCGFFRSGTAARLTINPTAMIQKASP